VAAFVALVALAPGAARAQEGPQSTCRYFAPPGYRPKEFTLVRKDGWFHLYYIRETIYPGVVAQKSFGHAISRDLYSWTELDTILAVVPGTFEGTQVWAPSVHRIGDTWWMFYTGMRDEPANGYHLAQSVTAATSTDLDHWQRLGRPLFGNEIFPWSYYDTTVAQGRDARDPFLWWDEASGEYLLFVATRPAFRPQSMAIGIAGSTDLEHWVDRGYVPITLPEVSFSDVAESPSIATGDGQRLIFIWTTNAGQALTYGQSSTGPVTGWGQSRRLRSMLGYTTTSGWWGSEFLHDGGRWYFGNIHNEWIDFWDLTWTAPDTFALAPPDLFQVLAAHFDPTEAAVGDSVRLTIWSIHGVGRTIPMSYVRLAGGLSQSLDPVALGLPDTLTLVGDSTTIEWSVPKPDDGLDFRLRASVVGSLDAADTLSVHVPLVAPPDIPSEDEDAPMVVKLIVFPGRIMRFVRGPEPVLWGVELYDARGRRIWADRGGAQERTLVWRGRDDAGRDAPVGIYFARVTRADGRPVQPLKVPLLR
jgi:hypothetical protein